MFVFPPTSRYETCLDCGDVVPRGTLDNHVCDRERKLDFTLVKMRPEIASFETAFAIYMQTSFGKFDAFYAGRDRLRRQILSGAAA